MITATFLLGAVSINVIQLHVDMIATTVIAADVQLLLWVSRNTAVGEMRNCGMRKVKCGVENAG